MTLSPLHALSLLVALAAAALPTTPARADDEPIPREVQYAVDRGLEWLARTQSSDGSWGGTCATCGGSTGNAIAATTSLSLMAFMARGHTPGQGPYGENLNRAVDAILRFQDPDGVIAQASLGQPMYDHGISTVALCEAYGMLDERRQDAARRAIAKAVRVILDAQSIRKSNDNQGGWRYTPRSNDSDTSVSGWQLMALRGASNIGANVPQAAIDAGIAYLKRRSQPLSGGGFSYMDGRGITIALTGTGVTALSLMGQADSPEVHAGGDYLLRQVSDMNLAGTSFYYYTIYYVSQAAWQLGGRYWTQLNQTLSANIRGKQKADGRWSGGESSDPYCTAMAVLALTVPYRYLPIYQR